MLSNLYLIAPLGPLFAGNGIAGLQGSKRPGAAGRQCHQTGREAASTASCYPQGGAQEPWGKPSKTTRRKKNQMKNHNTSNKRVV